MGNIPTAFRRREDPGDEIEMGADPAGARAAINQYRYPPKTGDLYFGNSFWIGGERFDMDASDGFLFGDNNDVNFFSGRPRAFPFRVPQVGQPISVLQSLMNIRRDTLKLVRSAPDSTEYRIEFVYDSDVEFTVSVYFQAFEITNIGGLRYQSAKEIPFKAQNVPAGFGLTYTSTSTFQPGLLDERCLSMPSDGPSGSLPLVILCEADESDLINQQSHAHVLISNLEKTLNLESSDDLYTAKPVKQKQEIDGTVFLLQEIFGLDGVPRNVRDAGDDAPAADVEEDAAAATAGDDSDDDDDGLDSLSQSGMECELCLSEPRDTMILPCRHLSICSSCADQLRYTACNCPFCRQPFSALIHIRAFKDVAPFTVTSPGGSPAKVTTSTTAGTSQIEIDGVPGCREVSLLEAVHGPSSAPPSAATSPARPPLTDSGVPESLADSTEPLEIPAVSSGKLSGHSDVHTTESSCSGISVHTRSSQSSTVGDSFAAGPPCTNVEDKSPPSATSSVVDLPGMVHDHARPQRDSLRDSSIGSIVVVPAPGGSYSPAEEDADEVPDDSDYVCTLDTSYTTAEV